MLEWMHDPNVIIGLTASKFQTSTLDSAIHFIDNSYNDSINIHMAICDSNDEYQGTVSLKNIDTDVRAEFAIVLRSQSMGKGFSQFGITEIIKYGFEEYALEEIYWQVLKTNQRAMHFYTKAGYKPVSPKPYMLKHYPDIKENEYLWFSITKAKYNS